MIKTLMASRVMCIGVHASLRISLRSAVAYSQVYARGLLLSMTGSAFIRSSIDGQAETTNLTAETSYCSTGRVTELRITSELLSPVMERPYTP